MSKAAAGRAENVRLGIDVKAFLKGAVQGVAAAAIALVVCNVILFLDELYLVALLADCILIPFYLVVGVLVGGLVAGLGAISTAVGSGGALIAVLVETAWSRLIERLSKDRATLPIDTVRERLAELSAELPAFLMDKIPGAGVLKPVLLRAFAVIVKITTNYLGQKTLPSLAKSGQTINISDVKNCSISTIVGGATTFVRLGIRKYQLLSGILGAIVMLVPIVLSLIVTRLM